MGKRGVKKSQQQKSQNVRKDLQRMADAGVKKTEKDNIDSLTAWLAEHPRACAHLVQSCIMHKSFDHLDGPDQKQSDTEDEKLPEWQNKLRLLNSKFTLRMLQEMLPLMAEWLGEVMQNTRVKVKKEVPNELLAFIVNADVTSAVPSKKVSELKAWLLDAHKKNGCRMSKFEPPEACQSLEDYHQKTVFELFKFRA